MKDIGELPRIASSLDDLDEDYKLEKRRDLFRYLLAGIILALIFLPLFMYFVR